MAEKLTLTPSQTIGPFFHFALPWIGGADLVGNSGLGARTELFPPEHNLLRTSQRASAPEGEAITIEGRLFDGEGHPVPDAMIEIWHAAADGTYDSAFTGFGRSATGADGSYRFRTIKPGPVEGPGGDRQAPHVAVSVFARGLLNRLITRLYFAGGQGNDEDPVLRQVPSNRRRTLLAHEVEPNVWRFDIRLQGDGETVFFAL